LNGWLEARSSPYLIALSLALVTIVLSVDLLTGDELTLSIFYLAPTALADWFAGRRAGLVIGFLAGAAWYVAAAIEFHGYSNAFVSTSNAAVRIAFLLVIAHLLTTLRAIGRRRTSWRNEFGLLLPETDEAAATIVVARFKSILSRLSRSPIRPRSAWVSRHSLRSQIPSRR